MDKKILYIGFSRLHRNRANLIQTLETVNAFNNLGIDICLYLPPSKVRKRSVKHRLISLGINPELKICFSTFLHSRWKKVYYIPFFVFYIKQMHNASYIYTRSPEISIGLSFFNFRHILEIHDVDKMIKEKILTHIIDKHKKGVIESLIPISELASTKLIENGAIEDRVCISRSGFNADIFKNLRKFNPKRLKKTKINYIGKIGMDRGLKIFEAIAEEKIASVNLYGDQDHFPYKISSSINTHPFVPHSQVSDLYDESDILIFPYQENLDTINSASPIKLFEALASNRPIIASNIPIMREILVDEYNALLVNPNDKKAWIEAIKRIQNDTELAMKLADNALLTSKNYSWDKRAEKILIHLENQRNNEAICR